MLCAPFGTGFRGFATEPCGLGRPGLNPSRGE
jgi:hypothetical protein